MLEQKIRLPLFILRLTTAAFFAVWAIEKFVKPEATVAIWKAFYFVENLPLEASYAIGVTQSLAILCFLFGLFKFWSYGFLMAIHLLSTVSTYERLLDPYTSVNHLFWAAVPAAGALIALFILREEDTMFTLSAKSATQKQPQSSQ